MPARVESYWQALEVVVGIKYDDKMKAFIKNLELDGHTEKSICYAIFKTQEKLAVYKNDSRFLSILKNEILKYSWPKGDPRWKEYWRRRDELEGAKELERIERIQEQEYERNTHYPGFVYFIQGENGGPIKIGYTVDAVKRLNTLQTGHPEILVLKKLFKGNKDDEIRFHSRLKEYHLRGEWFRPDVLEFADTIAKDLGEFREATKKKEREKELKKAKKYTAKPRTKYERRVK